MTIDEWRERIEECEGPRDLYDLTFQLLDEHKLVLSERDRLRLERTTPAIPQDEDYGGYPWG